MRLGLKSVLAGLTLVVASLFVFSGLAGAQDGSTQGAYVGAETVTKTPELAPVALGATAEKSPSSLAFTGGDAAGLALIGGVAVAAGVGVMVVRRRNLA